MQYKIPLGRLSTTSIPSLLQNIVEPNFLKRRRDAFLPLHPHFSARPRQLANTIPEKCTGKPILGGVGHKNYGAAMLPKPNLQNFGNQPSGGFAIDFFFFDPGRRPIPSRQRRSPAASATAR